MLKLFKKEVSQNKETHGLNAKRFSKLTFRFCLVIFIYGTTTSCSLFLKTSDTDRKNESYQLNFKNKIWSPIEKDTADYAYYNSSSSTIFMINSYCKKYQTTTLKNLTDHILTGITDRKILYQKDLKLYKRDALETHASGSMDGIQVQLKIITFLRNRCTYDFTLIGSKAFKKKDLATFQSVVRSINFNDRGE
ncbi:MAG: hypothetical protein HOE90_18985 [Bacteriovoracaceae bacterium]|jgi:hypothetical protein|nr:hypothetical protein [Bacteriovoracaceae bacterium]